jgi:hypothetical protein
MHRHKIDGALVDELHQTSAIGLLESYSSSKDELPFCIAAVEIMFTWLSGTSGSRIQSAEASRRPDRSRT